MAWRPCASARPNNYHDVTSMLATVGTEPDICVFRTDTRISSSAGVCTLRLLYVLIGAEVGCGYNFYSIVKGIKCSRGPFVSAGAVSTVFGNATTSNRASCVMMLVSRLCDASASVF